MSQKSSAEHAEGLLQNARVCQIIKITIMKLLATKVSTESCKSKKQSLMFEVKVFDFKLLGIDHSVFCSQDSRVTNRHGAETRGIADQHAPHVVTQRTY